MGVPHIIQDTNVIVAAMRSKQGASFRLLSLVGTQRFEIHDSVPLVLEYEEILEKQRSEFGLLRTHVAQLIDSLCSVAQHHEIFFLWRPTLADPNDEMILELAVAGRCDYIVTHNIRDFKGVEKFGI